MKRPVFLFAHIVFLFPFLAVTMAAQDPAPPPPPSPQPTEKAQPEEQTSVDPCPKVSIKAPTQPVREGVPVRFTASLAGGDRKVAPTYDWSISAGVVRSGQGTASIEVDTSGAGADRSIYATLLIGGYAPECTVSETATVPIAAPAKVADEFGSLPDAELTAKIESFASTVPPGDQVYIMAYAGRNDVRGYASSKLRQIRTVALKSGIPSDRLVTIDGGYREESVFELWLVPVGAEAPTPAPTVNARDIVFPKAAASSKARKP